MCPSLVRAVILTVICSRPCWSVDELPHPVTAMSVDQDGTVLVSASRDGLRILKLPDLRLQKSVPPSLEITHDVSFSRNGESLYLCGGIPGESGEVLCLAWPELHVRWRQVVSEDVAYTIALSPDARVIAVACHDHSIRLLNASDGKLIKKLTGHSKPVRSVRFLNDELMVSAGIDMSIRVWKTDGWTIRRTLKNHRQAVTSLAVSPAPGLTILASGSDDRTVRFWQPEIGRMVRFRRLASPVTALSFDATGDQLIAACRDGSVNLIQVATLETTQLRREGAWIHSLVIDADSGVIGDADGKLHQVTITKDEESESQ